MQPQFLPAKASSSHELVALYAYLIDARRFDDLKDLVTEDVSYENSLGKVVGWAALRQGVEVLTFYKATQHLLTNHVGRWEGDDFFGTTYCIASHLYDAEAGERKYDMGICYSEHLVRRNGAVKMRRRILNVLWQQDLPTTQQPPEPFRQALAGLMAGQT